MKQTVHYTEDVETEKKDVPVSVTSVSDEADLDNELDPVGLKKAFRFAVWASVILVRVTRKNIAWRVSDQRSHLLFTDVGIHDPHSPPSVWSIHRVWCGWFLCLGRGRNPVDVLFGVCGCAVPSMGK